MYRSYAVFGNASELEDPGSDMSLYKEIRNTHEAILSGNVPRLPVTEETLQQLMLEFYREEREFSYTLNSAQALEFYHTCLLPDIEEEKIGALRWGEDGALYSNVVVYLRLSAPIADYPEVEEELSVWRNNGTVYEYKDYQIPMDAEHCVDWIRANTGYEVLPITAGEAAYMRGVG